MRAAGVRCERGGIFFSWINFLADIILILMHYWHRIQIIKFIFVDMILLYTISFLKSNRLLRCLRDEWSITLLKMLLIRFVNFILMIKTQSKGLNLNNYS